MVNQIEMDSSPLLALRGMTKSFPGVKANNDVDLDIKGGEVHALLGENGAGKSTLMKILYGFYRADSGEILMSGKPVQIRSPHDARKYRIGMVFQEFILIPALTVAENIALFLPNLPFILDRASIIRRIEEVSERYGLQVNPKAFIWQLSVGERQKAEVLKLLLADARILIFDEPTRSLAPHEVEGLFQVFANLRHDGYAVVFITHKMKEVLACADRITVMRRGRVAGTLFASEATESRLISLMFGKTIDESPWTRSEITSEGGKPLLELKGISTQPEGKGWGLSGLYFLKTGQEVLMRLQGFSRRGKSFLNRTIIIGRSVPWQAPSRLPCRSGSLRTGPSETAPSAVRSRAASSLATTATQPSRDCASGGTSGLHRSERASLEWVVLR